MPSKNYLETWIYPPNFELESFDRTTNTAALLQSNSIPRVPHTRNPTKFTPYKHSIPMPMPIRRFPSSEDLTLATVSTATQTERVRVTFVDAINPRAGTDSEVYRDAQESLPIALAEVSDTEPSLPIPIGVRPLNAVRIDVALANALPTTSSVSPHGSRLESRDSVSRARYIASGFARLARGRGLSVVDGPLDTPASTSTSAPAEVEPDSDNEDPESRAILRFASTETVPTQHRYI